MSRTCSVCSHAKRAEIEAALLAGESFRHIAAQYAVSTSALQRHKASHLPAHLARAQDAADVAQADDVMAQLRLLFKRVNLLFDACDRWLRDADNPEQYDIGARAEDIDVTYWEPGANGKPAKKKAKLSTLLQQVQGQRAGFALELVETKHADPRELVLKTAARLQGQLELLGKLLGELDERPTVNVLVLPEWAAIRGAMVKALRPYPEARQAVAVALVQIEAGSVGA